MPSVIRAENDVAVHGDIIHISHISLSGAVLVGRDIPVVKDDYRPAGRRFFPERHGQQGIDLQPLRHVRGDIAVVIQAWFKHLFDHNLTAWEVSLAQVFNRERVGRRR